MEERKRATEAAPMEETYRKGSDYQPNIQWKMKFFVDSELTSNLMLPIDGLSLDVQAIINEYADVYQCQRDMIVSAIFSIVGSCVGKRLVIHDGKYKNYLCLWVVNVAHSGSNKSAPVKSLLQPIRETDVESYKRYKDEIKEWRKAGDEKQEKPKFKQHMLSDSTPEARNQVLFHNPLAQLSLPKKFSWKNRGISGV